MLCLHCWRVERSAVRARQNVTCFSILPSSLVAFRLPRANGTPLHEQGWVKDFTALISHAPPSCVPDYERACLFSCDFRVFRG